MSKILIIEDEEAIADLEKDYLELSGFEVEIEHRGDVGLKKALEGNYDLFILDLMLPEVDGFEICREIRNVKNNPVLVVEQITPVKLMINVSEGYFAKVKIGRASCRERVSNFV